MVNTKIVSRFQGDGDLPTGEGAALKINIGPLYPSEDVISILEAAGNSVRAWTKKCTADLQKWSLDDNDLIELVGLAVNRGRYIGSEWCLQRPTGPWAACDAYSIVRRSWVPAAHKEMDFEFYIKFAIGLSGNILLLASCHPPKD